MQTERLYWCLQITTMEYDGRADDEIEQHITITSQNIKHQPAESKKI